MQDHCKMYVLYIDEEGNQTTGPQPKRILSEISFGLQLGQFNFDGDALIAFAAPCPCALRVGSKFNDKIILELRTVTPK